MDEFDCRHDVIEQLVKNHIGMLKAVDEAQRSSDWSKVAEFAAYCREDLRQSLIWNIGQYLQERPHNQRLAELLELLQQ